MRDSPDSGVSVEDDVGGLCLAGSGDLESEDSLDGFIISKLDFEVRVLFILEIRFLRVFNSFKCSVLYNWAECYHRKQ